MPLQKPSSFSISRSKRVRCSMRCASTSLPCLLEEVDALAQFDLDRLDRAQRGLARRDVVAGRIDGEARHAAACTRPVSGSNSVSFSTSSSNRVMRIATSEFSAGNTSITSPRTRKVPRRNSSSLRSYCIAARRAMTSRWPMLLALAQVQDHAVVVDRVADAVDARHGGDDHRVLALQQRLGRRQAHLLDVLVDARVLLDEQVARRHVGLGLVVVVVGDEVLDRVLGEELAQLRVQLRRQRLVRREDQRRPAEARDDVGHGEGLARAGDARAASGRRARRRCPRPAWRSPRAGRPPARTAGAAGTGCRESSTWTDPPRRRKNGCCHAVPRKARIFSHSVAAAASAAACAVDRA